MMKLTKKLLPMIVIMNMILFNNDNANDNGNDTMIMIQVELYKDGTHNITLSKNNPDSYVQDRRPTYICTKLNACLFISYYIQCNLCLVLV